MLKDMSFENGERDTVNKICNDKRNHRGLKAANLSYGHNMINNSSCKRIKCEQLTENLIPVLRSNRAV